MRILNSLKMAPERLNMAPEELNRDRIKN